MKGSAGGMSRAFFSCAMDCGVDENCSGITVTGNTCLLRTDSTDAAQYDVISEVINRKQMVDNTGNDWVQFSERQS